MGTVFLITLQPSAKQVIRQTAYIHGYYIFHR